MYILAQILGFGAMICNVISLQQKRKKNLLLYQLLVSGLFTMSFFLLGAYAAFLQNVVATARNILFSRGKFSEKQSRSWTWVFIGLFLLAYVLTFVLFGEEFNVRNAIINGLPTAAMCIMSVAFGLKSVFKIRALAIINAVLWLTYSIIYMSMGDIVSEVLAIVSSVVGIIRYDLKKTDKG